MSGNLVSRALGGLLGCAVGDALGAPFEGYWPADLPPRESLLAGFGTFEGYPSGQWTDDTQLTVATLRAVIHGAVISPAAIAKRIARLWRRGEVIGPGGACQSAALAYLRSRDWRTCGAPEGQAGNGTAMRTGLLGLCFLRDPAGLPPTVADVCRITHHDPRSVAGGVGVAEAGRLLADGPGPLTDRPRFCAAVAAVMRPYHADFAALVAGLPAWLVGEPAEVDARIAFAGQSRPEFDRPTITPFIVPTVLACLAALLRHPDSWGDAVAAAIGMGGDTDTTGAITGTLAGIAHGDAGLPSHLAAGVVDGRRLRWLAGRFARVVASM